MTPARGPPSCSARRRATGFSGSIRPAVRPYTRRKAPATRPTRSRDASSTTACSRGIEYQSALFPVVDLTPFPDNDSAHGPFARSVATDRQMGTVGRGILQPLRSEIVEGEFITTTAAPPLSLSPQPSAP